MTLRAKQWIIALLGGAFVVSLIFVQYEEVTRRRIESGLEEETVVVPDSW